MSELTAVSSAVFPDTEKASSATEGVVWFAVTQSIPAMTCDAGPVLKQPSTRTDLSCTPFAAP